MPPSLKGSGISGCSVRISKAGTVVKCASGKYDLLRLRAQAQKQKLLHSYGFPVPKVLRVYRTGFEMEYIAGMDAVRYLGTASVPQLHSFTWQVASILSKMAILCPRETAPNAEWLHMKYYNVAALFPRERHLNDVVSAALQNPEKVPVGICHGDFTFANLIVKNDGQLYLCDPLDEQIQSVMVDIAKLYLDCKYGWSMLSRGSKPSERIREVFSFVQAGFVWHPPRWLRVLTLYRLLPYIRSVELAKVVQGWILQEAA